MGESTQVKGSEQISRDKKANKKGEKLVNVGRGKYAYLGSGQICRYKNAQKKREKLVNVGKGNRTNLQVQKCTQKKRKVGECR